MPAANEQECRRVRVVARVGQARVKVHTVELHQRSKVFGKPDIQPADGAEPFFVCPINDAGVGGDREAGPVFQIFAGRGVEARSAGSADPVRADSENDRGAVERFGYGDSSNERMNLADPGIVLKTDVEAGVPTVYYGGAHRCPINLAADQPDAGGKSFRVIGRPPDSLAFARSDGSGRDERRRLFRGLFG